MSKLNLTPEQQAAIENRGGSLLVSAAAGSGKTKVLVERLFRYVVEERCNVDDFLIITYTRAAAAELRGKIASELTARLAETPEDGHLKRQQMRVYGADIKTVDAFCTGLLRENIHLLGEENGSLTPDFRVLDEDEAQLLQERVLRRVLEQFYENPNEGSTELADTLGSGRDDSNLAALVLNLHGKLQSHAYPARWLREQAACWETTGDRIGETPYGAELLAGITRRAGYRKRLLEEMLRQMEGTPAVLKGYAPAFSVAADGISQLAAAADWSAAAAVTVTFPRLGSVKEADGGELKTRAKALWDATKKELLKLQKLLAVSEEEAMEDLRAVAPAMLSLLQLTEEFERAYGLEKVRRNATDFSDQEHLALQLLVREDGTPTEQGALVASRYREIMVDEYQDTNEVQNHIFRAVSQGEENLFTVGDVKQSIYRFRLADPSIFLRKYQEFLPYDQAEAGENRKILLSRNFRSRKEVLDGANFVFENVMSPELGEMDYGAEEKLNFGAEYYAPRTDCGVEFHLLDVVRGEEKRVTAEANFVAKRIRTLIDEGFPVSDGEGLRPCRAEDIVILMRSPTARSFAFHAALEGAGIACSSDATGDFFASMEIAVTYALLQIIDNPRQDVPLISVLRSPLFGFTPDRLASMRAKTPEGDFFDALQADGGDDCCAFLASLTRLRALAQDLSVHRLLFHIYNELNVLGIFGAMEGERKENLIALYEHARRFESAGYRGVFAFVTQLRRLLEAGKEPRTVRRGGSEGVRLLSIHKSKGLEFPIVILADLSKKFNKMDFDTPVLVHPSLGLGPERVDLSRHIRYPTIARQALLQLLQREAKSEELRILYVAMTRAKEKLILVCSHYGAKAQLQKLLVTASCPVQPESALDGESLGDWILLPLLCRPEAKPLRELAEMEAGALYTGADSPWRVELHSGSVHVEGGTMPSPVPPAPPQEDFDPTLLDFVYPYRAEVTLPAKLTATQLKGRELDEEISEHAAIAPRLHTLSRPQFLRERTALSPTERGTATHLALQYLDFSRPDVASQLHELQERHLLTPAQAESVEVSQLQMLLQSPLGEELRGAKEILREYRFTLLVDAARFQPEATAGDRILLQGVVDCCFAEKNGLCIVDFKTDRVFGEALARRAEEYRPQLEAYSEALEKVLEKPVSRKLLYFLQSGETIVL